MDWARAIDRNSEALQAIVATLFAMLGLAEGVTVGRIPRALRSTVLRILRPAEAAVRRLIVIAARGIVLKHVPPREKPKGKIIKKGTGSERPAVFKLEDTRPPMVPSGRRRRKFAKFGPRVHVYPYDTFFESMREKAAAAKVQAPDDGLIDGTRLGRRLQAIALALADIPKQAKRLARWKARRERIYEKRLIYTSPLRPGPAPGLRRGHHRKSFHEVEDVLRECHELAWEATRLDTS